MDLAAGVMVTRRRYTKNARTGDKVLSSEQQIGPFGYDPGGTREVNNLGVAVTSTPKLYGPYDVDVLASDELLLPGDPTPWEVDGEVARWKHPSTGWQAGCVIELTRQKG